MVAPENGNAPVLTVSDRVNQFLNQLRESGGLPRLVPVNPLHLQRLVELVARYDLLTVSLIRVGANLSKNPSDEAAVQELGGLLDALGRIAANSFQGIPPTAPKIIIPRLL